MKGLFIPEITAEMFRCGCLESIEALMAEGEIYDIDYEPEQRWIPVTEKLPKEDSDILVTYVEKDEKRIVPVNYGCGTWFDCLYNKVLNQVGVLAWMPLPEPWKEGEADG